MNFKKLFVTAAAVLAGVSAFAQTTPNEQATAITSNQVFLLATNDFAQRKDKMQPTENDKKVAAMMQNEVLPSLQSFCDMLINDVEDEKNIDETKMEGLANDLSNKSMKVAEQLINGLDFKEVNKQLNDALANTNMMLSKEVTREDVNLDYLALPLLAFEANFLSQTGDLSQQHYSIFMQFLAQIAQ